MTTATAAPTSTRSSGRTTKGGISTGRARAGHHRGLRVRGLFLPWRGERSPRHDRTGREHVQSAGSSLRSRVRAAGTEVRQSRLSASKEIPMIPTIRPRALCSCRSNGRVDHRARQAPPHASTRPAGQRKHHGQARAAPRTAIPIRMSVSSTYGIVVGSRATWSSIRDSDAATARPC